MDGPTTNELPWTIGRTGRDSGSRALRRASASFAVALLLGMSPAIGRGQAMGRVIVDGAAPASSASVTAPVVRSAAPVNSVSSAAVPVNSVSSAAVPVNTVSSAAALVRSTGTAADVDVAANLGPTPGAPSAMTTVSPAPGVRNIAPVPLGPVTPKPAPTSEPAAGGMGGEPETPAKSDLEHALIGGGQGGGGGGDSSKAGSGAETAHASLPSLGFGQVIAALAVVMGLIFVGRALVKKFVPGAKGGNGKGVIEILARHPLAKNQSLVLVRIGSQIVALNQGKDASQSVLVINDAQEVARIIGQIEGKNPNSLQAGFNKLLANARMDLESSPEDDGDLKSMSGENLDEQLEEMAAAKRQLMELRQHVRTVRDRLPRE